MKRFPFAPGAVEHHTVGWLCSAAQRRELVRWLKGATWWLAFCLLSGLAAGLITGWLP